MVFMLYDLYRWCLKECPIYFFPKDEEYVAVPTETKGKRIVTIQPTGMSVLGDSEWELVEELSTVKTE